ncbi:MATE family efflux transporter [Roseibium album]|uniref:MATE family efflux transporter n=1 Tax=Roseibium album TaxID=311410 RepID=UPI00329A7DF8
MSSDTSRKNVFTQGPLALTLLKTALPIILVMSMNGLLTVADAVFLGRFAGPDALSAVTLMFPAYMLLVAMATLVSNGMNSILARNLGGGQIDDARSVFSGAHGLALFTGAGAIVLFSAGGYPLILIAAEGSEPIAGMAYTYLAITVWTSPLLFVLSVQTGALRSEGFVMQMAGVSLLVSLANIVFNFVLVAILKLGVAGTAYGTALAQLLTFAVVILFRLRAKTVLKPGALLSYPLTAHWWSIFALGAPQSLNFAGIALSSAATFASLQYFGQEGYEATVAAFGIVTRIMTFVFLPLLGLTQALQAMIGNNYGAGEWKRSDDTLRLGLMTAFGYCLGAQILLTVFARPVGFLFVDDLQVSDELSRIMPITVALMFAAGPLFVIAAYFQALGDAIRAALISLIKPYFFFLPLLIALPAYFGETGIWLAGPAAEFLLVVLTAMILGVTARRKTLRWGLFVASTAKTNA